MTVVVSHGVADGVRTFATEDAALGYGRTVAIQRELTERTPTREFGAQVWLGQWGDEDGCAVVVARAAVAA